MAQPSATFPSVKISLLFMISNRDACKPVLAFGKKLPQVAIELILSLSGSRYMSQRPFTSLLCSFIYSLTSLRLQDKKKAFAELKLQPCLFSLTWDRFLKFNAILTFIVELAIDHKTDNYSEEKIANKLPWHQRNFRTSTDSRHFFFVLQFQHLIFNS